MGYEAIGMIEEVGEGVKDFKVGAFVVVPFTRDSRRCKICSSGFEANCPNAIDGMNGWLSSNWCRGISLRDLFSKEMEYSNSLWFFKRIRNSGAIVTDKAPSIPSDFKKLQFWFIY